MAEKPYRLIVVSNRLPVALKKEKNKWKVVSGSGGLITALAPVLRDRGGLWIGWSGGVGKKSTDKLFDDYADEAGYSLAPVHLTENEIQGYYYGFANEIIWPLFHDFQSTCNFDPSYWRAYLDVNLKFAEVVGQKSKPGDFIWVHDYHLMHLAFLLKNMGLPRKLGFFLHIPFPPPDIFLKLPWRTKLIQALLEFDLLGFQTVRDRRNFVRCAQTLISGFKTRGRGSVVTGQVKDKTMRIGGFPISIDFNNFAEIASRQEVSEKSFDIRKALKHRKIVLGVDRLDYTKGIPQRLEAMRSLLERYPDLHGRINFIQIAVPSRTEVKEYQDLKTEIETLVGQINGQFSVPGWVPIHYQYRNLPREELVAYYKAADIALVTPLRDGMNLVAKEYCACNLQENGVLILSEFAGAASQLQRCGAYLVNPHDTEGVARAIKKAFYWDNAERMNRTRKLRESIRRHNIYWWVDSFLNAAISKNLEDFPPVETVNFHNGK